MSSERMLMAYCASIVTVEPPSPSAALAVEVGRAKGCLSPGRSLEEVGDVTVRVPV